MDQDFVKKRLEKDLEDLKRMIALHFEQRKKDESELEELKTRIDKRKQVPGLSSDQMVKSSNVA